MSKRPLLAVRSLTLLIAFLVLMLGAGPAALAGQAGQPPSLQAASGPAPTTPLVEPGAPSAPQLLEQTSTVQMVLLPWSDPSIRVPPPEQFLAMRPAAVPGAAFQITYLAEGTPDPQNAARTCHTWATDAQTAFNYAASIWASSIYSPVPIRIKACWTDMGSTTILGSSSSWLLGLTYGNVTSLYSYSLADKLLGYDYDANNTDSSITYNSVFPWYFGTEGNPPANQVDFVSVVLHEMGHSLNFAGAMSYGAAQCTSATYGCWGLGTGFPDIYDRFVQNGSKQYLVDTTVFANPSAALGAQLTGGSLYFTGSNASLANGNSPVKIYAPSTWAPGSSYSHLDYNTFASTAHRLMVYAIPSGASIHNPGAVTMGLLKDLGWAPTVRIDDVSVQEGNGGTANASFSVSASHAVPWPVSVSWSTAAGTATADVDYVSASGTATIAAGATSQTLTVKVNGDATFEAPETFYVNLASAAGGYAFTDNQGVGTIQNDDPPPAAAVAASMSSSALVLAWPYVSPDIAYRVYRSTNPYFSPDSVQPLPLETYCIGGASCKYQAAVAPADPNYFYVVRATGWGTFADSNREGSFGYGLTVQ